MADEIDHATDRAEDFRQVALAARRRANPGPGDGICRACKQDIEPERMAVQPNALLCIECARDAAEYARRHSLRGV